MKNLIILVFLFIFILPTFSKPIELSVQELALKTNKQVIDEHSSEPISNAKIVIPVKIAIIIPIIIADGNSSLTAFEITDLSEIVNPTKHYRRTTTTILTEYFSRI